MSTLSQMGVPAAGFGILQPKQKFKWQVTFVALGALVPSASSRDLTRQAKVIQRPSLSFEEIAIHRYNSVAYVAGKHVWEPITFTVEDDVTGLASAAVQSQLQTQQRLVGGDLPGQWLNTSATGSDYKFGVILQQLDGNEGIVEQWNLEGCWIKASNYSELDYSSNDAVNIELTIRFDMANQILTGQGYGTALGGHLT